MGPLQTLLHLISVVTTADNVATVRRLRPSIEESEQEKWSLLEASKCIVRAASRLVHLEFGPHIGW